VKPQEFHLSSKHLLTVSQDQLSQFNDFNFIVNNQEFSINFSLISCISEKFIHFSREPQLHLETPNEIFQIFISFLEIFQGSPFIFEDHEIPSLLHFTHFFGIFFPLSFISDKISIPETLSQSIQYLSMKGCQSLENHFNQSLNIIFEHFHELSFHDISSIPLEHLEIIFSSDRLILEEEDQLFSIIINFAKLDSNKNVLFKFVHFEYVSSPLMISFFQDFHFGQFDFDLFEKLKQRLFCNVAPSYSDIPVNYIQ
jgi:hypothetical protein